MKRAFASIMVVTILCSIAHAEDKFDFRKTRWGMTKEEVIASEGENQRLESSRDELYFQEVIDGIAFFVSYDFIDNRLVSASYIQEKSFDSTSEDCIKTFFIFSKLLEENYGKVNEKHLTIPNYYKKHKENACLGVSIGAVSILFRWINNGTVIDLFLSRDINKLPSLSIHYASIKDLKRIKSSRADKEKKKL
ncbi:MAG: hypothetical protein AB7E51_14625 [Pseudodesulfovibrio sp.]|uniref:hypothetical protein n=1 Tax=Pseudodesulfovibrio sp. TaxID=2035812 RepID=UPI003D0D7C5A